MTKIRYISVILPLKLEWNPCYSCPDELMVGCRVKVPFSGKDYIGVVRNTLEDPEINPKKIKSVISVESGLGRILPEEIELWERVAEYYMCTVGEVYKAAYPSGKINLEEARAKARERSLKRNERIVLSIEAKVARLQTRLEKKELQAAASKEGTKIKATSIRDAEVIKKELAATSLALETALRNRNAIKEGLPGYVSPSHISSIQLSEAQISAYESILAGFGNRKPVMLHGVTGSGKTEIYIKLAQEALKSGRNVLYLVPEIALSHQLEERLYEHFGESLMTFHSGESGACRTSTAETLRQLSISKQQGNYIVLGTRSSLFLPHHNLGLIIVDEEHDSSYKQDSPAPRYNGRDTALILNQLQQQNHGSCNIILGSATPSLEELYNCQTGRHTAVHLRERYHGSADSETEIIDTRAERRKRGMIGSFSRKLIDRIRLVLDAKGQILILRSRRAWAPALQCENCGEIQKCPHCNVSLSFHKSNGMMVCHYCGHTAVYSGICSSCTSQLVPLGAGTQKIEEELAALFPSARIARLDSDTAQDKKFEARTIKDFSKGDIDILVGTQMITKGFDFSNLELVAVIAADSFLGMQDFRADEKALQIMEQFKGRCGRREKRGSFVIQTSQPDHPIYSRLTGHCSEDFADRLLSERMDFGFPPYSRIIEIIIKDSFEDRATRTAHGLADILRPHYANLTGPYSPTVDKVAGQHIRKIRICLKKDRQAAAAKEMLRKMVSEFARNRNCEGRITIDVDPS